METREEKIREEIKKKYRTKETFELIEKILGRCAKVS